MATLTGSTIAGSYDQLLALPSGGGNGTTLVALTDGNAANTFALELSTAGIKSTGTFEVDGLTTLAGDLRIEDDAGGQYVGISTPTEVTTYTLTMPAAVGSTGQVLETSDGSGTLAWVTREVGDITGVTAGTNLNGGGSSGVVTVNLDTVLSSMESAVFDTAVSAAAWGAAGPQLNCAAATFTDTSTAEDGTAAYAVINSFGIPTINTTETGTTVTNSATVFIAGPPVAGSNTTLDTTHSIWVDNGNSRFDGTLTVGGVATFDGTIEVGGSVLTDTILERTADEGVTIESVLVEDNTVTATTFTGALTGNAATATLASTVTVTDNASGTADRPVVFNDGSDALEDHSATFTYKPSTGTVAATIFSGALSGNATTATSATSVSGTVATGNGGTGLTSYLAGDVLYYSSGTTLSKLPSSGQGGKVLAMNSAATAPEWSSAGTGTVTGVTGTSPIVSSGGAAPAISIGDASTSAKGAASFSSDNFAVTSGAVTIKSAGVDLTDEVTGALPNANLANSTVTVGSTAISLGGTATTVAGLTLTTPVLGTPTSGTLTNCTFPTLNQDTTGNATTATTAATVTTAAQTTITSVGTLTDLTVSGTTTTIGTVTSGVWNGDAIAAGYLAAAGIAGSIQFSDGSAFDSDAVNLFWDDAEKYLGVGTAVPLALQHNEFSDPGTVYINDVDQFGLLIQNSSDTDNNWAQIAFRGTSTNAAWIGTQFVNNGAGYGDLVFGTRDSTGATEKLRIESNGRVTVKKSSNGEVKALTDASTVAIDFDDANNFSLLTTSGVGDSPRELGTPSNITAGQSGCIVITQDGSGSRALTYTSDWHFEDGADPVLSTAADAVDTLAYYCPTDAIVQAVLLKAFS